MASENVVTVTGTLTRDFELRFTVSGRAVANSAVAYNARRRNQATNEWEDGDPSFFDVSLWADMAENAAESLTKGMRVIVVGRLQQRSWETAEGEKRSKVEIVADEIGPSVRWASVSVEKKRRGGQSSGGGGGQQSGPVHDPGEEPF
jgi:single-strand DNA-binding protein